MSRVDVVIVNWNSGSQLRSCVMSLERVASTVGLGKVVIVDNASDDGSADDVESSLPIVCIRNRSNRGFGAACNQGALICDSKHLLFLNPDTEVFRESLAVPLEFMEAHENANVGASGIQLVDASGAVARTCARFPSSWGLCAVALGLPRIAPGWFRGLTLSEWPHDETRIVEHVIGAFYLIRRELFVALGGFDERYFVYLEDLDLSKAVNDCGYRIVYLASAKAFHRGGGTSDQVKGRRLFYSRRSRIQYAFKHFPFLAAMVAAFLTAIVEPFIMAARGLLRGSPQEMWQTLCGFALLWGNLPRMFLARKKDHSVALAEGIAISRGGRADDEERRAA